MDRGAGPITGIMLGGLYALYGLTQLGFGVARALFLWPHHPEADFPPHGDPRRVTKYADATLESLRGQGDIDPETEKLIVEIASRGGAAPGGGGVQQSEGPRARTLQPQPGSLPSTEAERANVRAFLIDLVGQPTFEIESFRKNKPPYLVALEKWAASHRAVPAFDPQKVDGAGEVFRQHLFWIALILSTSSLLETFACRKGVKVLAQTGYFSGHTNRRLAETLQFVLFVNAPGAFTTTDDGVNAVLKVRLVHAAIRWTLPRMQPWSIEDHGFPVNQEDLLGTVASFSAVIIRDLPKLGVRLTKEQAEDYLHLWSHVIGPMLGIRADLLPQNLAEAFALILAIQRRQQAPSDEGVEMTRALIAFHRAFLGPLMDPIGYWLMRRLAGDRVCDIDGVPWSSLLGVTASASVLWNPVEGWSQYVLARGTVAEDNAPTFGPYTIPESLQPSFAEVGL